MEYPQMTDKYDNSMDIAASPLQPCPFSHDFDQLRLAQSRTEPYVSDEADGEFAVVCRVCGGGTRRYYRRDMAIRAWNSRAAPTPAAAQPVDAEQQTREIEDFVKSCGISDDGDVAFPRLVDGIISRIAAALPADAPTDAPSADAEGRAREIVKAWNETLHSVTDHDDAQNDLIRRIAAALLSAPTDAETELLAEARRLYELITPGPFLSEDVGTQTESTWAVKRTDDLEWVADFRREEDADFWIVARDFWPKLVVSRSPEASISEALAEAAEYAMSLPMSEAGYQRLRTAVDAAKEWTAAATQSPAIISEAELDEIRECDKCDLCEDHHG